MASFKINNPVLDEGTTFVFDSWVCIANDLCGFNSRLATPQELETSASPPAPEPEGIIDTSGGILSNLP